MAQPVKPDDKKEKEMIKQSIRLVCISDTHNLHRKLTNRLTKLCKSPHDILIHAGDFSESGSLDEISDVDNWFKQLPYNNIFIISGNMDGISLDGDIDGHKAFNNAIYLQHEAHIIKFPDLNNAQFKIFGSPYTPQFVGGFQISDNKQGKKLWNQIPTDTDILICHGPPKDIMDITSRGWSVGDIELKDQVFKRIKPKVMIFGHVHPSHGVLNDQKSGIRFGNVAMFDNLIGKPNAKDHDPIVFEIQI